MFTAIQARNIADEKYNHMYYRLYKYYSAGIMRHITKTAKRGGLKCEYHNGCNSRMCRDVFAQIANELIKYGYHCNVRIENAKNKKYKYIVITIDWEDDADFIVT